jgi:hypothetical protein
VSRTPDKCGSLCCPSVSWPAARRQQGKAPPPPSGTVGIVPAALLGVEVRLEGCTSGADAALQNVAQHLPQRRGLVGGQGRNRPQGMDPGPPEGRLDVDVADARDPVLIEEEGLDRTAAALKQDSELVQRQIEGVWPELADHGVGGQLPYITRIAEPPMVVPAMYKAGLP